MRTSIIKAATFDKSFTGKFGTLYQHSVTLQNGDSGQINAKEEMPEWLTPGKELNYELTPNGKYPDKLKRVNPQFQQKGSDANTPSWQELHDRVSKLETVIRSLVKANKLVYTAEPALWQQKPVVKQEPAYVPPKYEKEIMEDDSSDLPF